MLFTVTICAQSVCLDRTCRSIPEPLQVGQWKPPGVKSVQGNMDQERNKESKKERERGRRWGREWGKQRMEGNFYFPWRHVYRQLSPNSSPSLGNTQRLISQTQLHLHHKERESERERETHMRHMSPFERSMKKEKKKKDELHFRKRSVFTFLYAQSTAAAPGLLYFKSPSNPRHSDPGLYCRISTALALIWIWILIRRPEADWRFERLGMSVATLPTAAIASVCQRLLRKIPSFIDPRAMAESDPGDDEWHNRDHIVMLTFCFSYLMVRWLVCVGVREAATRLQTASNWLLPHLNTLRRLKKKKSRHIDSRPPILMKNSSGRPAAASIYVCLLISAHHFRSCGVGLNITFRLKLDTQVFISADFLNRFPQDFFTTWPKCQASCSLWRAAQTGLPLFGFSRQESLKSQPRSCWCKEKEKKKRPSIQRAQDEETKTRDFAIFICAIMMTIFTFWRCMLSMLLLSL